MPKLLTKIKKYRRKHEYSGQKTLKHDTKLMSSTTFIDIGEPNVKKWKSLKTKCKFTTDWEFIKYLLELLENSLKSCHITTVDQIPTNPPSPVDVKPPIPEKDDSTVKQIKIEDVKSSNIQETCETKSITSTTTPKKSAESKIKKPGKFEKQSEKLELEKVVKRKKSKIISKSFTNHDIRKAPELNFKTPILIKEENKSEDTESKVKIKIKLCFGCDTRHLQNGCPLLTPIDKIVDNMTLHEWISKSSNAVKDTKCSSYANASLPSVFFLTKIADTHTHGVFTRETIKKFVELGPLIGPFIKEVNISDDFNMKYLWELKVGENLYYINTENTSNSNWIRYVRPSETRDKRNITAVVRDKSIYLVTISEIKPGEELRYWTDDGSTLTKKRVEKNNCGGCNLTFAHPIYYRTHCSIFHDARYSLTIRKYHCKVCGQAVLGKDNIVKHAAELHNGQGAYQCQFCQKFFLRLNYLEMHRTYGCAQNPHRSRPLCDFCGRKFCQPQKLKVHIKRMHSDISLSEFQCPLCLKLLGSRAAVQRHAREVHRSSVPSNSNENIPPTVQTQSNNNSSPKLSSSLSCSRCGKLFQNKSNLKIHMLTHSGVKPFKCKEESCQAAFTTKQCLQFHYKKVHGYTEEMMPVIERSVEYTFEAYSGGPNEEEETKTSLEQPKLFEKVIPRPPPETNEEEAYTKSEEPTHEVVKKVTPPLFEHHLDSSNDVTKETAEESDKTYQNPSTLPSKGSKKWLGDITREQSMKLNHDIYAFDDDPSGQESRHGADDASSVILDVDESQSENIDSSMLNVYNTRQESSNASLLVEAALDSVSDIQMSESNQHSDNLLNLYPLQQDGYLHTDLAERCSVADYDGFSAPNSPNHFEYIHDELRPHRYDRSPATTLPPSPPRYDFNQPMITDNISNDSEGTVAQNLTIKDRDQLDFSTYKSHYNDIDTDLGRKYDIRSKFDDAYNISLDVDGGRKSYDASLDLRNDYSDGIDNDLKKNYDTLDSDTLRALKYDLESKYDIELRNKGYDLLEADDLRSKIIYDSTLENELRGSKAYNILDSDFRSSDRSFEPLILNSELQGLDMSARSYHSFHSTPGVSRYHHMYGSDHDRESSYGPPTDVLRVVTLDLTSQGRHGSLHGLHHSHHGLLSDHNRLTLDQTRLLSSEHNLSVALLGAASGTDNRILSDHTTNRLLSNDQINDPPRLGSPDPHRLLSESASRLPTRGFSSYSMSPVAPYHPSPLSVATRSHIGSPTHNPPSYHHYSGYY